MDTSEFLAQYTDFLAPKLDPYEQAIYLYAVRHSRLLDLPEVTIGVNAAAKDGIFGLGNSGSGMSPSNCRKKVRSLEKKACLHVIASQHDGFRLDVRLPSEIPGLIPAPFPTAETDLEAIDFFGPRQNRQLILERDSYKCFYCLRVIDSDTYVIEHVVNQSEGGNGYCNVVAACRTCNNRKGSLSAVALLRLLYREGLLDEVEHQARQGELERLTAGFIRPDFSRAIIAR